MSFREDEIGGTARCGRCAGILPDETLTFCPKCGVPFSRVPPTDTYTPFQEKREIQERSRERRRFYALSALALFSLSLCLAIAGRVVNDQSLRRLSSFPAIEFYTFDVSEFPKLSPSARRQSIAIAVQAFEDHFGFPLRDYSIHEDRLPEEVAPYFQGPWNGDDLSAESPMLLSFWEKRLYPKLFREWRSKPARPLRVLITNIPLFANTMKDSDLELRHLSGSGLVSGLGHPSFVVTTTYRMLTRDDEFAKAGASMRTEGDYSRHLGEYILAHELGHALLGLPDFVVSNAKPMPGLRSPASVGGASTDQNDPVETDCLMHTDEGGGFEAWKHLSRRTLGMPSACHAYVAGLDAFDLRNQSLALYRAGHATQAKERHTEALRRAEAGGLQEWVIARWREEQGWFSGFSLLK